MFKELKRKIATLVIVLYLDGVIETKRGRFKIIKEIVFDGYDLKSYVSNEDDRATYIKQFLFYLPTIANMITPDIKGVTLTEPEAIFAYNCKEAIKRGIIGGEKNIRQFNEEFLDKPNFAVPHVIECVDSIGNFAAITMNADNYYSDLGMGILFTLFQVFESHDQEYSQAYLEKYGRTWLQQLKWEQRDKNKRVMKIKYELAHPEEAEKYDIEIINEDGEYKVIKKEKMEVKV